MTVAELIVKVKGDISGLTRDLAAAGVEVKAFANDTSSSTSKVKRAWRDAESGLLNFARAENDVTRQMNRGPFGLVGAFGEGIGVALRFGGAMQKGATDLGAWISTADQGGSALTALGGSLSSVAPLLGVVASGAAMLGVGLAVLPALAFVVVAALTALADILGTLAAMAVAAVGPLGFLAFIVGGMGYAFVLAGERAIKGGGHLTEFANAVKGLTSQFHVLIRTLASDFLPYFDRLVHAARVALHYFNQLAQMPLNKAFHSLSTTGVKMLTSFLDQVGQVLAKPFRLAIRFAFGTGGHSLESSLGGIMSQLQGYLFGHTVQVPIGAQQRHGIQVPQTRNITGALQPIINWFNRQHFTQTGIRWGHDLINGLRASGFSKYLVSVARDAGHQGGKAFAAAFGWEIEHLIPNLLGWFHDQLSHEANWQMRVFGHAWDWVRQKASSVWGWITSKIGSAWSAVTSRLESRWSGFTQGISRMWSSFTSFLSSSISTAWDSIKTTAEGIWDQIVSYIERPFTIHINWPSPPSWLSHLPGSSLFGSVVHGITGSSAAGHIITRPTVRRVGESGAEAIIPLTGAAGRNALAAMGGGGGGVVININNPTFMSGWRPAARELARILKPELDRIVHAR